MLGYIYWITMGYLKIKLYMSDGCLRIRLQICEDNLTLMQDRLAQYLIHSSHSGISECPELWAVCGRRMWLCTACRGLTLNRPGGFNFKFTRERRAAEG